MPGMAIPRWLAYSFGWGVVALSGLCWSVLGVALPPFIGGWSGLLVSVAGIVVTVAVLYYTPKPETLDSIKGLAWWASLVAMTTLTVTSLCTYTLPFLGEIAMQAIFGTLVGGEIGPLDMV